MKKWNKKRYAALFAFVMAVCITGFGMTETVWAQEQQTESRQTERAETVIQSPLQDEQSEVSNQDGQTAVQSDRTETQGSQLADADQPEQKPLHERFLRVSGKKMTQSKAVKARKYTLKNVTEAAPVNGAWVKVRNHTRFRQDSGKFIKNRWIQADHQIYYMNARGNRVSGWVLYRKHYYYMKEDGTLYQGWLRQGKRTYFFGFDGAMVTARKMIGGAAYYFDPKTGVRQTGWITIKKNQYYFSPKTGQMKKSSWIKKSKKYYYVNSSGKKLRSCWLTIGKDKYYLDEEGARVTGKLFLKNKGYYFKKNGVYDPDVKVKPEVDPTKPMVALTYDDGPGPYTDRLLNCLKNNDAKATFFMVGYSVPNYKNTVKRMAVMGCELGNHSYSHPAFTTLSSASIRSQVDRTSQEIRSASGKSPTVFRLPYGDGSTGSYILNSIGLPSIYWSIDTRDWANTGNPQHTVNHVLNNVKDGDIILMHDVHRSTVTASEQIIPALKKRGYQLVTVSQLAKYKGKTTLKNGVTYTGFR